ncbi:two-component system response regulator [Dehalogenimonas sp. THU2]|uniref:response regulator n=1 Tax=Dehalogenimonas sp. THU2 TaxID=3151121 RepID=UPI003218B65B
MNRDARLVEKPTVLVVDDTPDNLVLMTDLLKDKYTVKIANNGERAVRIASTGTVPDIILLDVMMPVMDGYEACRQLKSKPETKDIPVIFLTAKSEIADEIKGFELGAVDYITKPISPPILKARLQTHLELKNFRDFLKDKNALLEKEVQERTRDVVAIQEATVLALTSLAETRDNETGNHIIRTQRYVEVLARALKDHPKFNNVLNDDQSISLIVKSAPLHDIGKVGIPDNILLKKDRLTEAEFNLMKTHTILGRNAILSAEERLGVTMPFLNFAREITYCHHERWDGTGYPNGLAGEDIPVSGRLMAIADVYDALISRRVYKEGLSHEKAVEIILEGNGSHFDPDMINAFAGITSEFLQISTEVADT